MKILLVYPQYADTFFNFTHVLKFISKKAIYPPLGLLTVASMLPGSWEKKLVDMNVTELTDTEILWADYIFISAMQVQKSSAIEVIDRCNKLHRKIVAGGPLFTSNYDEFKGIDHLVLGEAEVTLVAFLSDLAVDRAKPIYISNERPELTSTTFPLWSLINMKNYGTMSIQYSRGCPFDCEFCDIIYLNGHWPRTKSPAQFVNELELLYKNGWRGQVFVVDDNFIGNKNKLKSEVLPSVIKWMKQNNYPFYFTTQASINIADDEVLMQLMTEAGFTSIFIGIESPNQESLDECGKKQNMGRNLPLSVKLIQNKGLEVLGGFVVGFDSDPPDIFESQIELIQNSGIVIAIVSMLNAPRGTRLYKRLESEGRLLNERPDDSADCNINFIPKLDFKKLFIGYKNLCTTIYSPDIYYRRVLQFFNEYKPQRRYRVVPSLNYFSSFMRSLWLLGIIENGRGYFWKLLFTTSLKYPHLFWQAISFSIYRLHFYKHSQGLETSPRFLNR